MTYIVTPIDHSEKGVALMPSQFNSSDKLLDLLRSWLETFDDLEQCLHDWAKLNKVTTAEGEFLDIIGSWMKVPRGFRSDSEYRQAILAQSVMEGMDGTTERFLEGMRVVGQTNEATFYQSYPATVYAHMGDGWNNYTYDQLNRIVPAGCHLRLLVDHNLESMTLDEILEEDNGLSTGEGDQYIAVIDGVEYNYTTSVTLSASSDGSGDILAELFDEEWVPMADIVTQSRTAKEGLIIDNNNNFLSDNLDNNVTFREF